MVSVSFVKISISYSKECYFNLFSAVIVKIETATSEPEEK